MSRSGMLVLRRLGRVLRRVGEDPGQRVGYSVGLGFLGSIWMGEWVGVCVVVKIYEW
jgi:hypothetical protein